MSNETEKKSLCPECHRMAAVGTSRGHAIDCKFEGRATNEAEVPPRRLWLPLEAALLLRGDEHGPHEIEYVPASALEDFRQRAIEAVRALFHNSEVNNSRWNLAMSKRLKQFNQENGLKDTARLMAVIDCGHCVVCADHK